MDILVINPDHAARAEKFQHYVSGQGHRATRIAPGQRLPAAEACWLGAVFFDSDQADLPTLLGELYEPLRYLGAPLVVVAAQPSADYEKRARAAGAELICELDTPDAQILNELTSRCQIRPVEKDIRAQLAEPLITAVRQTLSQMAGAEVSVRSVYRRPSPIALGDVSATLTISHTLEGALILSFSMTAAEAFARRILGDASAPVDPIMTKDCTGEIANIIAGQAKALFAGTPYHFAFSTPIVTLGPQALKLKENMESVVIAFDSAQGALALQLCRQR